MRSTDHLDPFNLQRFLQAQDPVFDRVQDELNNGHKRSHWMWFIFPQFAGLGGSEMSRRFAIRSREEALAYLEHPLLGARLRTCTQEVLNIRERSVAGIFGHPDDLKFHSSMTLFAQVDAADSLFQQALNQYFHGILDDWTLSLMDSKQAQLPPNQG
ncbi:MULTISPECIES: DUF1810 domain-containing protein [Pseudomonas]|jgi:uncharacterized protein (DUF1810 family)|uniref:DUF1810 domain-containing protein n=1 Tax=Pseudomonas TaxID=286 RepID=UPI000D5EE73E|nr:MULTISPECIES: DUF1810 domain-containing protein [Pseudomonas]MBV7575444.1 DUF1810 domain-containing protein [Pseudomonas sp. PDM32]PVZ56921.1 DUF1810 domain-containing protein [Pseudomonas sp. B1(2018)]QXH60290.1 DUF1810 domain-containing protein [Pseudomonas azerbaijanorientalis]UVM03412.1 DUF1810 domain-containing protein [Pseudomonas laurylsulfatiphila]